MKVQITRIGQYDRNVSLNVVYDVIEEERDHGQDFLTIANDIGEETSIFRDQCISIEEKKLSTVLDELEVWAKYFPYKLKNSDVVDQVNIMREKLSRDFIMAWEMGRANSHKSGYRFYNATFNNTLKRKL
jgi:hypothetical protein